MRVHTKVKSKGARLWEAMSLHVGEQNKNQDQKKRGGGKNCKDRNKPSPIYT